MALRKLLSHNHHKYQELNESEVIINEKYKKLASVRCIQLNQTLSVQEKLNQLATLDNVHMETALKASTNANCEYLKFLTSLLNQGANVKNLITLLRQKDNKGHAYASALAKHQDDPLVIYHFIKLLVVALEKDQSAADDILALLKETNQHDNHMGPSLAVKANAFNYLFCLIRLVAMGANLQSIEEILTTPNKSGNSKGRTIGGGLRKKLDIRGRPNDTVGICDRTSEKYIALVLLMQEKGLANEKAIHLLTIADLREPTLKNAMRDLNVKALKQLPTQGRISFFSDPHQRSGSAAPSNHIQSSDTVRNEEIFTDSSNMEAPMGSDEEFERGVKNKR